MPYAQIDDRLDSHPKVQQTSDTALGLWLRGQTYCARNLTDGYLGVGFVSTIVRGRARLKAARELVDRGWWTPDGDGYLVAGYLDHNPSRAEVEERRQRARERQERFKQRRRQDVLPWTGEVVDNA